MRPDRDGHKKIPKTCNEASTCGAGTLGGDRRRLVTDALVRPGRATEGVRGDWRTLRTATRACQCESAPGARPAQDRASPAGPRSPADGRNHSPRLALHRPLGWTHSLHRPVAGRAHSNASPQEARNPVLHRRSTRPPQPSAAAEATVPTGIQAGGCGSASGKL